MRCSSASSPLPTRRRCAGLGTTVYLQRALMVYPVGGVQAAAILGRVVGCAAEGDQSKPSPSPRCPQSISDEDILALVNEEVHAPPAIIELLDLQVRVAVLQCIQYVMEEAHRIGLHFLTCLPSLWWRQPLQHEQLASEQVGGWLGSAAPA